MTFLRLSRAHLVAVIAALALLVVMAVDWYSTEFGEEQRRIERIEGPPEEDVPDVVGREVVDRTSISAEEEEENAWQASGALDRIALVLMLATVVLALAGAALRAADRRFEPPLTPSVAAAGAGTLAAIVVMFRIVQVGAVEVGGVVKIGAPLGLLAVGVVAVAAARAAGRERAETAASAS